MKTKITVLIIAIAIICTMLSSCEVLKFANHMLNIFGPEDDNNVNIDVNINLPVGDGKHTHSWLTVPGKESTCKEHGCTDKIYCPDCGLVGEESVELPLLNHTVQVLKGYSETKTTAGKTAGKKCSVCGEILEAQKEIPATGSIGLEYMLNYEEDAYWVAGIGTCNDTDIVIPSIYNGLPVISIGSSAFSNCDFIESVVILPGTKEIYYQAFYICSSLKSVTIPNTVETIDYYAFGMCQNLGSIIIPNSVKTMDEWVFAGCDKLTIYCEANSKPSGWNGNWNAVFYNDEATYYTDVIWGYKH